MTGKAIYKFPLTQPGDLRMQQGARILTVQMQNGEPVLWAMVNPNAPLVARRIAAVATGTPFDEYEPRLTFEPSDGIYISTLQLPSGLVFHIFDGGEVE